MAEFQTKRDAQASQARALLTAAKKHKALHAALGILEQAYTYTAKNDFDDGK